MRVRGRDGVVSQGGGLRERGSAVAPVARRRASGPGCCTTLPLTNCCGAAACRCGPPTPSRRGERRTRWGGARSSTPGGRLCPLAVKAVVWPNPRRSSSGGGAPLIPAAWGTAGLLHGVWLRARYIHELPAGSGVGEGPPPAGAAGYLPYGISCPPGEPTVVCPMVGASHGCDGCAPQRLHHCVGRDGKPRRFQPCHGTQASRP